MEFIPQSSESTDVPYFSDATSEGGWQGHTTGKSLQALKSEITGAIGRLGGMVIGFQRGAYTVEGKQREGFRIRYVLETEGGTMPGQMDVAALPVRDAQRQRRSYEKRKERSLKMALYMLRNALDGLWFLQQLSLGYASLMPWMIEQKSGKTITQLWSESAAMSNLLPAGDGEFEEGEFKEVPTEERR
jgi:hypothetical protein